jgi:hypothetical protein
MCCILRTLHLDADGNHWIWREKPSRIPFGGHRTPQRGRPQAGVVTTGLTPIVEHTTADFHLAGESPAYAHPYEPVNGGGPSRVRVGGRPTLVPPVRAGCKAAHRCGGIVGGE